MSNILIRNGQQKDAEILSKIYASSWKHAYRGIVPDEYLKNLKDDFWVEKFKKWIGERILKVKLIYLDDEPAGAISYGKSRDDKFPDYGEIWSFYMKPEYFRKGLGRKLINSAISDMVDKGFKNCYLWVLDKNKNARRFYEKSGFKYNKDKYRSKIMDTELFELRYVLDLNSDNDF
ncbi:GNAT family N-acetyltransferase [uncultured Clostridium sp.]|uniref:GNAT family N-acetyltransferase n=1 Tax=uncultured Clostridium sp. TaxID=59620 RepID=UPI0025E56FEF|nr:GNAT family N-acetyltransferase [uncultured Clostridium sp.]